MRWMFVVGVKMEGSRWCCGDLLNPDIRVSSLYMGGVSRFSASCWTFPGLEAQRVWRPEQSVFPVSECRRGNTSQIKHTVNE